MLDDPTGRTDPRFEDVLVITGASGGLIGSSLGIDLPKARKLWVDAHAAPRWLVVLWSHGAFSSVSGKLAALRAWRDVDFRHTLVTAFTLGGVRAVTSLIEAAKGETRGH